MTPVTVQESRAIPVALDDAFRDTVPIPLPDLFGHWHGPIPPIKEVRDQVGEWGTVGQTRTVFLTGGGSMREELVVVDPPRLFGYRLDEIRGPMGPLVKRIEGEWSFEAVGTGTEVTWRWAIHPRSDLLRPAVVGIGHLWHGYARKALAVLSDQLIG